MAWPPSGLADGGETARAHAQGPLRRARVCRTAGEPAVSLGTRAAGHGRAGLAGRRPARRRWPWPKGGGREVARRARTRPWCVSAPLTVFRLTLLSAVAQAGEGASATSVALVGSMSRVPGRRTALTTRGHRAVRLPSSTKAGRVRPLGSAGLTCPVEPGRILRARRGPFLIQKDSSRRRHPHRRRRPFWLGVSAYLSSLPSHEAVHALS